MLTLTPCAETHDAHNNTAQQVANSCSSNENNGLTTPFQSLSNLVDLGEVGTTLCSDSSTFDHDDFTNLEVTMANTQSIEFNLEYSDDYYAYEPLTELLPAEDVSSQNGDQEFSAEDGSDSDNP